MSTNRIPFLDNIKGFLIILVVLGHVLQYTFDIDCIVDRYIYSFHMPLFMAVSGYCSYKENLKWNVIKKRAIQLLLPFFAWAVVQSLLMGDITYVWTIMEYPDRGLWFLLTLFYIASIVVAVNKCSRWGYTSLFIIWILITALSLGLGIKTFGIPFIGWHLPFYTLGYAMKQFDVLERINIKIFIGFFLVWCISGYWCSENSMIPVLSIASGSLAIQHVLFRIVSMGIAVFAIIGWFGIFRIFINSNGKTLTFLGRKTLSIYAVILSTELFLFTIIRPYTSQLPYALEVILLTVFLLGFALLADFILGKNKYTGMLFLGKRLQ